MPKVKFFLWRIANNCLSTMSGLFQRRSCASPLCPLCSEFTESTEHSILLCPWTKAVSFASPLNYHIDIQAVTVLPHLPNGLLLWHLLGRARILVAVASSLPWSSFAGKSGIQMSRLLQPLASLSFPNCQEGYVVHGGVQCSQSP